MSRTAAIVLMTVLSATAASAHPRLQASNPAPGATLKAAPKDIRMTFSEELIAGFTGLDLKNANGKSLPTGKTMLIPGDSRKIVVSVGTRLTPGTYTVTWHAVSMDTHRVSGSYWFKIKP